MGKHKEQKSELFGGIFKPFKRIRARSKAAIRSFFVKFHVLLKKNIVPCWNLSVAVFAEFGAQKMT